MERTAAFKRHALALLLTATLLLAGCAAGGENEQAPANTDGQASEPRAALVPEKLERGEDGVPMLSVYQQDEERVADMDVETYLHGVLAGEMKNDWPMEALKAQAILARTFVLKFCSEKQSRYEGADISTDIEEAQAYDATGINERVIQAVEETRGLVLTHQGALPYAWFHAHSGGMTATAQEGLGYKQEAPYTQNVRGEESDAAPSSTAEWEADFTAEEFVAAAKKAGVVVSTVESVSVGERGDSGRAVTILVGGQAVSAPELRIALGADKMRSTLLTSLKIANGSVHMAGKGFGHGVGMPQWGAYALAEQGRSAEEIVSYYFKDITVEKAW